MDVIYRCCCGIDVHKKLIVACLRKGGKSELREFGTMTGEIKELAGGATGELDRVRTLQGEVKLRIVEVEFHQKNQ